MNAPRPAAPAFRRVIAAVAALLTLGFAACGGKTAWPPAAVDPDLGRDACASCRMIVSDARFAAELVDRDGTVEFFDDVGCLRSLLAARGGAACDPQAIFVRSFDDARWIRGDECVVVKSAAFASPMGFCAAAFATRSAAETEARKHADARLFELPSLLRQGDPR
jgi:copper chaperone NosL